MKEKKNIWQPVVLAVLGILLVLTLLLPEQILFSAEKKRVEISVIFREENSDVGSQVRKGMEQAAEENGAELRFLTLTADNDSTKQLDLIRRQGDVGVDSLILFPADNQAISTFLKTWNEIPVVTLESPVEQVVYVGPDNSEIGHTMGEQILQDFPQGGKVLFVDLSPNCYGVHSRRVEAQKVLEEAGFEVDGCRKATSKLLAWADIVLCFEENALEHTASLMEEMEAPPALYISDNTPLALSMLETGKAEAITFWSQYAAGYLSVDRAVKAALHKRPENYTLPIYTARKEDISDPNMQKLLYPAD